MEKCLWCESPATGLCDAPIGFEAVGAARDKTGKVTVLLAGSGSSWTCDAPMCDEHRRQIGHVCGKEPDSIDRCPYHYTNHGQPLRELVIFESEVAAVRRKVRAEINRSIMKEHNGTAIQAVGH